MSRLRRVLRETPGFALMIVTVEAGLLREEVVRRLAVWSGRDGVPTMRLMLAEQFELLAQLSARDGLVLVEPDHSLLEAKIELVQLLNWQRDGLRRSVLGPLVLVLSKAGHQVLFEQAPDLYSWRRHLVAITPAMPTLHVPSATGIDLRQLEERLRLQAILEDLSKKGALPRLARAALQSRVAQLLVREGRYLEAETAALESQAMYRKEEDEIGQLLALLIQADAALRQGHRPSAAHLLAQVIALRQSISPEREIAQSRTRVDGDSKDMSQWIAVLFADLHLDRDPRQVLQELQRVHFEACSDGDQAFLLFLQAAAHQRLEELDVAAEKLSQAKAIYDQLGDPAGQLLSSPPSPLEDGERLGVLAWTQLRLGAALAASTDPAESREKLDLAEHAFHDLGDLAGLERVAEIRGQLEERSSPDR